MANAGHFSPISWPVSRGTGWNQLELHGTEPRTKWQISAVLSMVSVCSQENKWCPEEHSHRAPKRLIFPANLQRKITGTINSTNRSSGKGWMALDRGKIHRPTPS